MFVPHIEHNSPHPHHMEMLELHAGEDIHSFTRDKWGIPILPSPETRRKATPDAIDIIFTPGVAFDVTGRRLGNGKGYYDVFFEKYDQDRASIGLEKVQKYGLALQEMIVSTVPITEHDVIMDGVITGNGVITSMD